MEFALKAVGTLLLAWLAIALIALLIVPALSPEMFPGAASYRDAVLMIIARGADFFLENPLRLLNLID